MTPVTILSASLSQMFSLDGQFLTRTTDVFPALIFEVEVEDDDDLFSSHLRIGSNSEGEEKEELVKDYFDACSANLRLTHSNFADISPMSPDSGNGSGTENES